MRCRGLFDAGGGRAQHHTRGAEASVRPGVAGDHPRQSRSLKHQPGQRAAACNGGAVGREATAPSGLGMILPAFV
eukprot:4605268-Pyramimonas_sp.AAC.1